MNSEMTKIGSLQESPVDFPFGNQMASPFFTRQKLNTLELVTIIVGQIEMTVMNPGDITKFIKDITPNFSGEMVHLNDGTFIVTFDNPTQAVHYGIELCDIARAYQDVKITLEIHVRECQRNVSIISQTADLVNAMLAIVAPNQILVSETVRHLISNQSLKFIPYQSSVSPRGDKKSPLFKVYVPKKHAQVSTIKELSDAEKILKEVMHIIEVNLADENFRVSTLCKEIGISERQLYRKLKLISQQSPTQFITSARLHRARKLILTQQLSLGEIAFQTGFSNPSYFAQCFKKKFGVLPSAFGSHRREVHQ